jgi:hypothetical protein
VWTGSEFRAPAEDDRAPTASRSAPDPAALLLLAAAVLVVDDNTDAANFTEVLLTMLDMKSEAADGGRQSRRRAVLTRMSFSWTSTCRGLMAWMQHAAFVSSP